MDGDNPLVNDSVVQALARSIDTAEGGLHNTPNLLRRVIDEGMWRRRVVERTGEWVEFFEFEDFIKTPPLEGLGTTTEKLRQIVAHDEEVAQKLGSVLKELRPAINNNGGDRKTVQSNRVTLKAERRGNDPDYLLGLLKRDRPDLASRVVSGELKAKTAARMAGFKRPVTEVYLDDMGDAARKLANKLDADQIDDLIAELQKHRG